MREWDLPRDASELAAAKLTYDRPENKVVRPDGTEYCRRCGRDWADFVHGC